MDFEAAIAAARSGDERAWRVLYHSVAPQLLGYLRGRGSLDPEGLLGETLLHVARGIGRFDGTESGFRSWVFTIAHHRLVDERRSAARRPTIRPIDGVDPAASDDIESDVVDALHSTVEWLDVLGDEQRDIVLLRNVAGLSAAEVGALLGKSAGAVRVAHHRALRVLRDRLSDETCNESTGRNDHQTRAPSKRSGRHD